MTGRGSKMDSVYLVYDRDDHLLYVGVTNNIVRRKGYHRNCTEWYPSAVRWAIREYDTRSRAEAVEAKAIVLLRPIHNIAGQRDQKARWGRGPKLPHLTRKARREAFERLGYDNKEDL